MTTSDPIKRNGLPTKFWEKKSWNNNSEKNVSSRRKTKIKYENDIKYTKIFV